MNTLKVSREMLDQIIFALERRIVELNNRGSEPVEGAILLTAQALELAVESKDYLRGLA